MMERVLGPIPEHMLRRVEWVLFYKCYKSFYMVIQQFVNFFLVLLVVVQPTC